MKIVAPPTPNASIDMDARFPIRKTPATTLIVFVDKNAQIPAAAIVIKISRTDSYFLIADKAYHIECQSTSDSSMIIRMIEYDFSISLESLRLEDGKYRMYFPNSCILFLRGNAGRKMLSIEMVMPDGSTTEYKVSAIYVGHYTKNEILQKKLFFLLPFYIMRYEKKSFRHTRPGIAKDVGGIPRD